MLKESNASILMNLLIMRRLTTAFQAFDALRYAQVCSAGEHKGAGYQNDGHQKKWIHICGDGKRAKHAEDDLPCIQNGFW